MTSCEGFLLIGDAQDEHVVAVLAAVADAVPYALLDLPSVHHRSWSLGDGLEIGENASRFRPMRGWLRRLSPPHFTRGIELGSRRAVEMQAGAQLLAAIADPCVSRIEWLSTYSRIIRAENKLVQYEVASARGHKVPPWRVSTNALDLAVLGERVALKPLGVGSYVEGDQGYALHTAVRSLDDPILAGLAAAPYLAQRFVEAAAHLRVPTVHQSAWPCRLRADGLPVDWRADLAAHASWEVARDEVEVAVAAVDVAEALGLGYTSQDWIIDRDGEAWLVDVNPGGQWLFLPDEVGSAVSRAIAEWLCGADPR